LKLNTARRIVSINLKLPHFFVEIVSGEIVQYLY